MISSAESKRVYGTMQTNDFEDNFKIQKPREEARISFLQTFIPKAIVYIPVIGEIARPIIFKSIENLWNKHKNDNDHIKATVFQILKYYKNVNEGFGKVNASVMIGAALIAMLVSPMFITMAPALSLGLLIGGSILLILAVFTYKENIGRFESDFIKDIRKNYPNVQL
ncbi:hypothetical protein BN1013_01871 [Candidatus Rubidus massiliensis]|nr:hypothetical protein BN1013_01871 [Candidatus Rubidus massiliensis]